LWKPYALSWRVKLAKVLVLKYRGSTMVAKLVESVMHTVVPSPPHEMYPASFGSFSISYRLARKAGISFVPSRHRNLVRRMSAGGMPSSSSPAVSSPSSSSRRAGVSALDGSRRRFDPDDAIVFLRLAGDA